MNRVDVVIPCYNYGHYLRGCVESVLGQDGVEVRLLILDDASPDHTPEVAADLMREDDRVEYRRHRQNRGHINTYNEGLLEWAAGDYALLLSPDDLVCPGSLRRAVNLMERHRHVGMVYGLAVVFHSDSEVRDFPINVAEEEHRVLAGGELIEWSCGEVCNPVPTPTAVVRTAVLRQVGGYNERLPHTADLELWLRFAATAAVGIMNTPQAFYRRHASNMTYTYCRSALQDLKEFRDAYDAFFERHGGTLSDAGRLQRLANERMAETAFWRGSDAFEAGDLASCEECLAFAAATHPPITSGRSWARLRLKRYLGPRAWSVLSSMLGRRTPPRARRPAPDRKPRVIGYWPGSRRRHATPLPTTPEDAGVVLALDH